MMEVGDKPVVIAPSYVKIPAVELNYLMLDALEAATKADNLIVIGSGLRPEDTFLTLLVTQFLRKRKLPTNRIIVVGHNSASEIKQRIQRYWGLEVGKRLRIVDSGLKCGISDLISEIDTPQSP